LNPGPTSSEEEVNPKLGKFGSEVEGNGEGALKEITKPDRKGIRTKSLRKKGGGATEGEVKNSWAHKKKWRKEGGLETKKGQKKLTDGGPGGEGRRNKN